MSATVPPRIVVLAKAPRPGLAKTRLIPALGTAGAARLARRMLDHALAQARAAGAGPVELCMSPGPDDPAWRGVDLPGDVDRSAQGEGDLGQRMARVVRRVTADRPVLLMGTDCPALTGARIADAARALARHEAALIPASDGGYVLIGLRAPCDAVFQAMHWSTSRVAAETLRRFAAAGLGVWRGPTLDDVDEPADLRHLPGDWNFVEKWLFPASNGHSAL